MFFWKTSASFLPTTHDQTISAQNKHAAKSPICWAIPSPTSIHLFYIETTSGIYLLPVELLLGIFAPLSKQDLAALQLTSKSLGDVASHLYLDSITICAAAPDMWTYTPLSGIQD